MSEEEEEGIGRDRGERPVGTIYNFIYTSNINVLMMVVHTVIPPPPSSPLLLSSVFCSVCVCVK